jgi:hypothetical protein
VYDIEHCFNFYTGLVAEYRGQDPDVIRKLKQVTREVEKAAEAEYDSLNSKKSEQDKADELKFRRSLCSYQDTYPYYFLDTGDKEEYWKYLFEADENLGNSDGLLNFLKDFFFTFAPDEIVSVKQQAAFIRLRAVLVRVSTAIYEFFSLHPKHMSPGAQRVVE